MPPLTCAKGGATGLPRASSCRHGLTSESLSGESLMSHFEFFMVLAAVVVAVAMTEIVGGWGRLLRSSAEIKLDWLYLGWTLFVLLASMIYWVGMLPYESFQFAYLGHVWLLVIPTLFLVLVSFALSAEVPSDGDLRLRDHYLSKRRHIFFGLIGFIITGWLADFFITGYLSFREILYPALMVIIFLSLALTARIWIHSALLVLTLAIHLPIAFLEMDGFLARFSS